MKAAAALLLAAAGFLTGWVLRDRLRQSVRVADALYRMNAEIGNRLLYLRQPLPQITALLSADSAFAALPFLADCAAQCSAGVSFPQAWQSTASAFLRGQHLREDRVPLVQLGVSLTAADGEQIERLLELYAGQFLALRQSAQTALEKTGRLYLYVCGAGGILLGILVL